MTTRQTLAATSLLLAGGQTAHAQYAPPPPPAPSAGLVNDYLRSQDAQMKNWNLGGDNRVRYEDKSGFGIQGVAGSIDFRDHGADVVNQYFVDRLRFHIGYNASWIGAYVEGRSSVEWGDERAAYANNPAVPGTAKYVGSGPETDSIDLQQAYLTLGNPNQFPLSLKVGRQELVYGEERLIGTSGWNNIMRVFDAAKLRYQSDSFSVDLFGSRPVIPEDDRLNISNDYEYLSGIYLTTPLIPKNSLEVYLLARDANGQAIAAEPRPQFTQASARDILTLGFRLKSKAGALGNWDYTVETAGQLGSYKDLRLGANSSRLDHQAYMAVLQGGYTFNNTWAKPRLGLEYSYGSGDGNPTDGKHETFDNLYPTNHKFYGYMDFFSLQNVHDARAIFQLKPTKQLSVALEGHAFWLADTHDNFYNVNGVPRGGIGPTPGTGYGINPNYSSFVGTEVELIAGYAISKTTLLEAGYGHFFSGDYIKQSLSAPAFGSRDADYLYVQATISF